MKKRILFLENKRYYDDLGIVKAIDNQLFEFEYDGNKNYKISDEELKKYDIIISCLFHDYLSNFMIIKALKNGIKTALVSDGIIEWCNMFENPFLRKMDIELYHPIIHDLFICVGEEEKRYFEFLSNKCALYLPSRVITNFEKIPLPYNNKILITTANTAYFNVEERLNLVELLRKTIEDLKNENVMYRIYDQYLIDQLNIESKDNYINCSFEEILKEVDIVITTPSSIVVNSIYHERAVAQLIYRDSPLFIQSGWQINGSINCLKTINSMKSRDYHRINYQKYQLANYIDIDNINVSLLDNKEEKSVFINAQLIKMLNSKFNYNIMYTLRNIYLKLNRIKKVNELCKKIKK